MFVMFSDSFWLVFWVVGFYHNICVAPCVFGLLFGMFDFESRIEGQLRAPHFTRRTDPLQVRTLKTTTNMLWLVSIRFILMLEYYRLPYIDRRTCTSE